jgi:hypothetical protein
MKTEEILLGLLGLVLVAGCTGANPYYNPGDAEPDGAEADGNTPDADVDGRVDDGRSDDGTAEDAARDEGAADEAADEGAVEDVVEVADEAAGPICGNGVVETGEECDDTSGFCTDCALGGPDGWVRCTDAAGNVALFYIEDWAGNHTAEEFADHCRAMVEDQTPEDFAYYGLGVFYDEDLWDCIRPSLVVGTEYWLGLSQDTTAGDYAEPAGGWYWTGYDGSGWIDAAAFDPGNGYVGGTFDNGPAPNAECARLQGNAGGWNALDYSCTTATDYSGICMIRF